MSAFADAPDNTSAPEGDAPNGAAFREGWTFVAGALGVALPLALIDRRLAAPPLLLAGAIAAFFRDPRRITPPDNGTIYAAADGFVLEVDEVDEPWFLGGRALRIVTFLSIFDVHVNRSPVAGTLRRTEHFDGGYAAAMNRSASETNERQLLAIDGARGPVVVVQIAGLIARRIRRWVEPGATLRAGQKLGMIKFGSRTDVIVPLGQAATLVQKGDRVRAGITPIARYV
ncbi:MAG: phosphatidylserine decarboxylase [Thermomicrobiales bacterium]